MIMSYAPSDTRERLSKEERIVQRFMEENPDLRTLQAYRQVVEDEQKS